MRKMFLSITLSVSLFLFWSCPTSPPPAPAESEPKIEEQVEEALQVQAEDDVAFRNIYQSYQDRLILTHAQKYTVVRGDVLNQIARKFYVGKVPDNAGFYWPLIMLASNDVVLDPERIEPGMELTIPDIQENLSNPDARAMIKEYLKEVATAYRERGRISDEKGFIALSNSL